MSWRDEYQPGSFRGVGFRTESHEHSGGRRAVVHEFPGRDEPMVEDQGRKARQFSIEVFVAGDAYFRDRDALVAVLNTAGPGTLVHPWLGAMQVSVLDWTLAESTDEGGIGRFSITFSEAGLPISASQSADGPALSIAAADRAAANAPQAFAAEFGIEGWPAFVEQAAGEIVSGIATFTQFTAGIGGGAGPALRAFETGLAALGVGGILRTPLTLGHAILGLVQSVSLLTGSSRRRISAFSSMLSYAPAAAPAAATPARAAQARNESALFHLYHVAAAAELVRTIAAVSFSSQDEAIAVRNQAIVQLDLLGQSAADAGRDSRVATLDMLRHAVIRDIALRSPGLARTYDSELKATEPALAVANRLYGHDLAPTMADDIVARNGVRHPGFVPGGSILKVIANG